MTSIFNVQLAFDIEPDGPCTLPSLGRRHVFAANLDDSLLDRCDGFERGDTISAFAVATIYGPWHVLPMSDASEARRHLPELGVSDQREGAAAVLDDYVGAGK
jgi:hypothetical protein